MVYRNNYSLKTQKFEKPSVKNYPCLSRTKKNFDHLGTNLFNVFLYNTHALIIIVIIFYCKPYILKRNYR